MSLKPIKRIEHFLARIAGDEGDVLTPITRIEKFLQRIIDTGGGGGGSGTDSNAVHYSADSDKTDAERAAALANVGGEPVAFCVNFTEPGGVWSADKTFAEIDEVYTSGGKVAFYVGNEFYGYAVAISSSFVAFQYNGSETGGTAYWLKYRSNGISFGQVGMSATPATVTDLSSTSITLASAADNTEYRYGELSALTISAITNPGEFSITFTSGATATVLTVPNTMIMPDGFAVEANTRYEINCKDGYALVAGWAVGA